MHLRFVNVRVIILSSNNSPSVKNDDPLPQAGGVRFFQGAKNSLSTLSFTIYGFTGRYTVSSGDTEASRSSSFCSKRNLPAIISWRNSAVSSGNNTCISNVIIRSLTVRSSSETSRLSCAWAHDLELRVQRVPHWHTRTDRRRSTPPRRAWPISLPTSFSMFLRRDTSLPASLNGRDATPTGPDRDTIRCAIKACVLLKAMHFHNETWYALHLNQHDNDMDGSVKVSTWCQ
jgi:hypothetical protein